MRAPSVLALVIRGLSTLWIIDVRRGTQDGLTLRVVEETPASLRPGRYAVIPMPALQTMIDRLSYAQRGLELLSHITGELVRWRKKRAPKSSNR